MSVVVQISHDSSGATINLCINTHGRLTLVKRDHKGKTYEATDIVEATKANLDMCIESLKRLSVHAS